MSGPLNYTTSVSAKRTAGECLDLLARAGADAVAVTYREKLPSGLAFRLDTALGAREFSMPVNVDGVHVMLKESYDAGQIKSSRGRAAQSFTTRQHALDVAWRIAKDWLEAQLAIIAARMATLDQVMLPYLQVKGGQTLFEAYQRQGLAELEAGR